MKSVLESGPHNEDWINKLDDTILESCILPLLPMRDAVETSLISRRWRHLWRHSVLTRRNLVFDSANVFGSRPREYGFIHNVAKFVKEYKEVYQGEKVDSLKIESTFFLAPESTRCLDDWVRLAIEKGVEEIQLLFKRTVFDRSTLDDKYVFPYQLLLQGSTTLKNLSLTSCVLRPPPDFHGFKHLKSLSLNLVTFDQNFMVPLLSNCSLLESLKIKNSFGLSHLILNIVGHRLSDLKMSECRGIVLSAPNLVSLEYDGYFDSIIFVETPPRLARVVTRVRIIPTASELHQLASFPELQTLLLGYGESLDELPEISTDLNFKKLKQLSIKLYQPGVSDNLDHLGSVRDILKAAPLLEEFVLSELDYRYPEDMNGTKVECCSESSFTHEHLKSVKLQGFRGNWYEIEFAIWILKHAAKLESLVINPAGEYYDEFSEEWRDLREDYHPECLSPWKEDRILLKEKLEQLKTSSVRLIIESEY